MGIQATPQNPYLDQASKGLRWARDTLDVVPLPKWAGGGLGQAVVGQAPEEVNEWSYGNAPYQMPPQGVRLPQIKQGRADGVISAAFLPMAEVGGLAKMGARGLRSGTEALLNVGGSAGRRQFLQQAGGAAATVAAASAVPPVLRTLMGDGARTAEKAVAADALKTTAGAVARRGYPEFFAGINRLKTARETGLRGLAEEYEPKLSEAFAADKAEWAQHPENAQRIRDWYNDPRSKELDVPHPFHEEHIYGDTSVSPRFDALNIEREYKQRGLDAQLLAEEDAHRAHPDFKGMKTSEEVYEQARSAGHSYDNAHEIANKHFASYGGMTNDAAEAHVRAGGKYVDPESGLHGVIDPNHGGFEWFSPRTGDSGRHQHWVNDDHTLPEKFSPNSLRRTAPSGGF